MGPRAGCQNPESVGAARFPKVGTTPVDVVGEYRQAPRRGLLERVHDEALEQRLVLQDVVGKSRHPPHRLFNGLCHGSTGGLHLVFFRSRLEAEQLESLVDEQAGQGPSLLFADHPGDETRNDLREGPDDERPSAELHAELEYRQDRRQEVLNVGRSVGECLRAGDLPHELRARTVQRDERIVVGVVLFGDESCDGKILCRGVLGKDELGDMEIELVPQLVDVERCLALNRRWLRAVLTPAQPLRDLFGDRAILRRKLSLHQVQQPADHGACERRQPGEQRAQTKRRGSFHSLHRNLDRTLGEVLEGAEELLEGRTELCRRRVRVDGGVDFRFTDRASLARAEIGGERLEEGLDFPQRRLVVSDQETRRHPLGPTGVDTGGFIRELEERLVQRLILDLGEEQGKFLCRAVVFRFELVRGHEGAVGKRRGGPGRPKRGRRSLVEESKFIQEWGTTRRHASPSVVDRSFWCHRSTSSPCRTSLARLLIERTRSAISSLRTPGEILSVRQEGAGGGAERRRRMTRGLVLRGPPADQVTGLASFNASADPARGLGLDS